MPLRSKSIRAAIVAAAYIDKKFFAVAKGLPWSLAEGDILANLDRLHSLPVAEQEHSVTRKIRKLISMGFNKQQLVQGVTLFRRIHWTTTGVEQGADRSPGDRFHTDAGIFLGL